MSKIGTSYAWWHNGNIVEVITYSRDDMEMKEAKSRVEGRRGEVSDLVRGFADNLV